MIHRYQKKGLNFVLDVNSGAVHLLDDISYAVSGLLDENNIPYIAQGNSIGGYLTIVAGTSGTFGTDILVGKNVYEKAKELMDSINWDALDNETEIPEEEWNTGEPPEV